MENVSHIVGCSEPIEHGFKTCTDSKHWEAEQKFRDAGQAAFQLKKCFECFASSTTGSDSPDNVEEAEELDTGSEAVFKARIQSSDVDLGKEQLNTADQTVSQAVRAERQRKTGEVKICGQFGQKRTHNEQLIIC